jgi:hypothetical protein
MLRDFIANMTILKEGRIKKNGRKGHLPKSLAFPKQIQTFEMAELMLLDAKL